MEVDRKSVGLTHETQLLFAEIEERGWFVDGQALARFSMAYAIRAGIPEGGTPGTETRWAAGNFDESGEIQALIAALYPGSDTPVRLMEHLVNEGVRLIAARLKSDAVGPAELMS